jgi:hypothetical protein
VLCKRDDGIPVGAADPHLRLYPRFAEPLRDRLRARAAELAAAAGITIEHIANSHIRKEEVVAKVLAGRGDHPGLVHVISAMEACPTYKPWHSKETHRK